MVTLYNNPALHQEALNQPARVIPPRDNESLYKWIENTGRFMLAQPDISNEDKSTDELEDIIGTSIYGLDKEEEDSDEWELD